MMKYKVAIVVFAMALLGFSTETQAQFYSGYAYNNNAYMNYAMASQRARAAGHKSRVSKKRRTSKQVRRSNKLHRRSHSRTRR